MRRTLTCVLAVAAIGAIGCEDPAGPAETGAADPFRQSIARNIANQDLASVTIACDAAEARLGKSKLTSELEDWLRLVPACNAATSGQWDEAARLMPGARPGETVVARNTPLPIYEIGYRASYANCGYDPEGLFAEAGTRDHQKAAEWLAAGYTEGPSRDGSMTGCLDALRGEPSKYP